MTRRLFEDWIGPAIGVALMVAAVAIVVLLAIAGEDPAGFVDL